MNQVSFENGSLDKAYLEALRFTKSHYENFPVVSLFLPKNLQKHIAVVYEFARKADDFADEGDMIAEYRIQKLDSYENQFRKCLEGSYENDFWKALHNTIVQFNLTTQYFYDLISAFKQDVKKNRYDSYDEILDYCRRSANPVGRIILEFFGIKGNKLLTYSDAVCTALQLTNFYQDVSIDIKKDRIYIPGDEMSTFYVAEEHFQLRKSDDNFKRLIKYQADRTWELFRIGKNLIPELPRNLKRQIKMTILGGEKILDKIASLDYDVLNSRPRLSKFDYAAIFLKAFML